MNNNLTDRQRETLGHALWREMAFSNPIDVIELADSLGVLAQLARYAHMAVAEVDRRIVEKQKQKGPDDDLKIETYK